MRLSNVTDICQCQRRNKVWHRMSTVLLTHVQFHEPPQTQMKNHLHGWECNFGQDDTFQWLEHSLWDISHVPENEQVLKGSMWWEAVGKIRLPPCDTSMVEVVFSKVTWDLCSQTTNIVIPYVWNRWTQPAEQIKTIFLAHSEDCYHI